MGSYTSARATEMVATKCAICALPLVDADSVETGVGPTCRAKHGFKTACVEPEPAALLKWTVELARPDARGCVNVLTYRIAAMQDGPDVPEMIGAIYALGYRKLANAIGKRVGTVHIEIANGEIAVRAPYSQSFIAAVKRIPRRRWDPEQKLNVVPIDAKRELWTALKDCYAGSMLIGTFPQSPLRL